MFKFLRGLTVVFSLLMLPFAASASEESPLTVAGATTVTVDEAIELFDQGVPFIDVRKPSDFESLPPHRITAAMVHHLAMDERLGIAHRVRHAAMERRFFEHIDFCIYNSPQTAESVRVRGRYNGPGAIALPGRKDGEPVESPRRDEVPPLKLCYIGNVIRRKGLHLLIEAMGDINGSNIELQVVGNTQTEPAYFRKLEKSIERQGLSEQIRFLGYVEDERKDEILRESHAMVMPSSHEGFGIAYLEAMRFGCVPVASASGVGVGVGVGSAPPPQT